MSDRPKRTSVDISDQAITWQNTNDYAEFLGLDRLLSLQEPQWLGKHDEVMFIVVHQVSELWIKLMMHELTHLRGLIHDGDLAGMEPVFLRIRRIQEQLLHCWGVTVTLEPVKYLEFREGKRFQGSSGFQSYQYRMLEFILGNRNAQLIEVHRNKPTIHAQMLDVLSKPSLYDETLRLLARKGLPVPAAALERDWSQPYQASDEVERVWLRIYREYRAHWELYRFAESLIDIEYRFQQWRFTHMKTVERLIGHRKGTGGSQGVGYLMKALDITFFPELWSVRTMLNLADPGQQP